MARLSGNITRIVREKGYGFIEVDGDRGGDPEYFFHRGSSAAFEALQEDQPVWFEVDRDVKPGKGPRARAVVPK